MPRVPYTYSVICTSKLISHNTQRKRAPRLLHQNLQFHACGQQPQTHTHTRTRNRTHTKAATFNTPRVCSMHYPKVTFSVISRVSCRARARVHRVPLPSVKLGPPAIKYHITHKHAHAQFTLSAPGLICASTANRATRVYRWCWWCM